MAYEVPTLYSSDRLRETTIIPFAGLKPYSRVPDHFVTSVRPVEVLRIHFKVEIHTHELMTVAMDTVVINESDINIVCCSSARERIVVSR